MGSLWIDYGVFGLLLLASISVSIWSKLSGPKEKTKADYVFAQNNVSMGAMILSIARGFLGVRVFLGYPSELYYRGSEMWETLYGMVLAFPIVLYFFVPVYFNLGVTSVYQYLDMRFKSRFVRRLASGTYLFRSLLNLGVTVFTPCVALKTVLGSPYSLSIIAITSISIVFTVLVSVSRQSWGTHHCYHEHINCFHRIGWSKVSYHG
uniref:Sodium-dependent multivitamin transporter n=1 Tax=Cacopsylla melanoneura TaxID=428564 RepID=A0A8D9FI94_9HEMI